MRNDLTDVTILLDRSDSMNFNYSGTISAFNEFLSEQKQQIGETCITLHLFNRHLDTVYTALPVNRAPRLSRDNFLTDGMTALYDNLRLAIDLTGKRLAETPEHLRPGRVVFAIITDGVDNKSAPGSREVVRAQIEHQKSVYSWTFVFMGTQIDVATTASGLGIPSGNTIEFVHNSEGIHHTVRKMSDGLGRMKSLGHNSSENLFDG